MTQTNFPATVVLVHAAWADASSWDKIIPPLQRRGLEVVAVQIPLSSLSDDAATLRLTEAVDALLHEALPDPQRIGRRA